MISCCFSCILLCGRVVATGYTTYTFLLWNLVLALVPYAISNWLPVSRHRFKNKWLFFFLFALWLLFIPNSFYIITDLFHFRNITSAPGWFDLLLLLSFAWNGLLLGIVSLRKIEIVLHAKRGRNFSHLVVFAVMWLNAWGIYIGRYLRYNSWDVITQPFALFGDMVEMMLNPFDNRTEWGMIMCYAVFMALLYMSVKKLSSLFNQQEQIQNHL